MEQTFLELYDRLSGEDTARAVFVATGVPRPAATIRGWVRDARAGRGLPDWVVPQLPAVIRAMQVEVERGK